MGDPVFEILDPGIAATLQDSGRIGWRRFGVPPGGVMDEHAAHWANRLLDNPSGAPVVEFLLQGAKLKALRGTWIALGGAAAANVPNTNRFANLAALGQSPTIRSENKHSACIRRRFQWARPFPGLPLPKVHFVRVRARGDSQRRTVRSEGQLAKNIGRNLMPEEFRS